MLRNYLTNFVPPTKFVLIEDTLEHRANGLLNYLVDSHVKQQRFQVNYFVFEGVFGRKKAGFDNSSIFLHDYVCHTKINDFEQAVNEIDSNTIILIDSLSNLIVHCGLYKACSILKGIVNNKNVTQLIGVIHLDTLEDATQTVKYIEHLATCYLKLQSNVPLHNSKITYTFKKIGGKIIHQTEEYRFENGSLVTEPIKKLDAKALVQESITILPDKLTTFKISLGEKDKESRDKLVLPYLPKDQNSSEESKIFYQFDHTDDWDEEDPDDDLDI